MTSPQAGRARIIDANLNRIGEGLRVIEDIARLLAGDPQLTTRLKGIRHRLLEGPLSFNLSLLDARDAEGDIGRDIRAPGQDEPKDLPLVVVANSRRVQESLRVIEEIAKTPGAPELDPALVQECRFELYAIERSLVSRLLRRDKTARLSGLYVLLDATALTPEQAGVLAEKAIRAGAHAIELKCPEAEPLALLAGLRELCRRHQVLLIAMGRVDLAAAGDADGVRLEPGGLPAAAARRLMTFDKILGCSVRTPEEAVFAQKDGADYLIMNIADSASAIPRVKGKVDLPLVVVAFRGAIGNNMAEIRAAGADAVGIEVASPDAWLAV